MVEIHKSLHEFVQVGSYLPDHLWLRAIARCKAVLMPFSTEAVVFDARTAKIVGLAVEVGLPHDDHRVHRGRGSHTRYQTKRCCRGSRRALGHVMSRPNRKTTGQSLEIVILWLRVEIHETVSGTAAQDQHLRSRISSRITPRASTKLPQSMKFARCDGTACFDIHLSIHTRMVAAVHSTLRGPLPQRLNQGRSSLKSRRNHYHQWITRMIPCRQERKRSAACSRRFEMPPPMCLRAFRSTGRPEAKEAHMFVKHGAFGVSCRP